jgi:5'-nucleotidase/UDP-sugar diphosphatase
MNIIISSRRNYILKRYVAFLMSALLIALMLPAAALAEVKPALIYEGTGDLTVNHLASYSTGADWEASGAEIVAYDAVNKRAYLLNGAETTLEILDLSKLASGTGVQKLEAWKKVKLVDLGLSGIHDITSVAVDPKGAWVALTLVANPAHNNGKAAFLDKDGALLGTVEVGALPDMIGVTPDGKTVFTANEGQPNDDYSIDPEGSVSLIDVSAGVKNIAQSAVTTITFNKESIIDTGVRNGKDGASIAQSLEPEYIAASADSKTLYVTLQENNAIATVDVAAKTFTSVRGLGFKDHSIAGQGLDASDKDDVVSIKRWPVKGVYMPDGIDAVSIGGKTYLLTANEGDAREYEDFIDETRLKDLEGQLALKAAHYGGYTQAQLDELTAGDLLKPEQLGRLKVISDLGKNAEGKYEALYSYGARSFTIWDAATMERVYDSGDQFERVTSKAHPELFNVSNSDVVKDGRSDDKGPEPEDVKTGVIDGQTYAFVGLERDGGVMVYNITNPAQAEFSLYFSTRDYATEHGVDSGPEGLRFVPAEQSPTGHALLLAGYEVSGTLSIYELKSAPKTTKITLLHTNDTHGRAEEAANDGMGFAKISALVRQFKADNKNTLLLDAGDTLHGTTFATLLKGESIVDVMNSVGYDAMAAGNHDFNYGYERLLELEDLMVFSLLSANVKHEDGTRLFTPYVIKEVDGVKLGLFGLTTPETTYKTHPNNVKGLIFTDPAEEAKQMVAELEGKVDAIIAVTHLGIDESSTDTSIKVAMEAPGIDLIVDGHSHSTLVEGLKADHNTLIVSSGEYTKNLGVVELVFDANKKLTSKNARLIAKETTANVDPDPTIVKVIDEVKQSQQAALSEVVGYSAVRLEGEREYVRTGETNLGNLIADAMLDVTGADVSLTNGGGIRASIAAGDITKGDVITVLPFGNYIVTKKVRGSDLKAALENGSSAYPESKGAFAHVGGIAFQIDPNKPVGERVYAILVDGKPLDMNREYVLATNDFIAAGGDEYTMFIDDEIVGEYPALDEALISYIQKLGTVNAAVEGRIGAAQAAASPHTGTGVTPPANEKEYVVKYGDNLWSIGRRFGTAWHKLAELNKLSNPALIHPGQRIILQ